MLHVTDVNDVEILVKESARDTIEVCVCLNTQYKVQSTQIFVVFLFRVYIGNKIVLRSQGPVVNIGTVLTQNINKKFFVK